MPNMFTELCTQSLAGVAERRFVVGKSRFKRQLHTFKIGGAVVFCRQGCKLALVIGHLSGKFEVLTGKQGSLIGHPDAPHL